MSYLHFTTAAGLVLGSLLVGKAIANPDKLAFFESKIRPVLSEHCYECHSEAGKQKADLVVDYRDGLLRGGEGGPAVVPGKPEQSALLKVIAHSPDYPEMPKAGPKLGDEVIADFTKWISEGAFDPRDEPPSAEDIAKETSWEVVRERRKGWWSFQPVRKLHPPGGDAGAVDTFVNQALAKAGLDAAGRAEKSVLLRRVSFVLTGLPPTTEEIEAFLADDAADAYDRLVDRLLASPRFGERWARHWLDWVRYAESHGSEGDPMIPHAYQYRDYLIRALNADVPYDQLVREHLAGDLLDEPRINKELEINESAIGPAHFRFVFHGFAPTDALDEQVRFTDNQIDVVSKAFLGLTVSCARCHNHKFDAISQTDFYAMYGIFASCKPALVNIDAPGKLTADAEEMRKLKDAIKGIVAGWWQLGYPGGFAKRLREPDEAMKKAIEAAGSPSDPLYAWHVLKDKSGEEFIGARDELAKRYAESAARLEARKAKHHFRLGDPDDYAHWSRHGAAPTSSGGFTVAESGDQLISQILPSGAYSHLLSSKHNAVFESPKMELDGEYRIYARVAGGDDAMLRYVVQNYPRNGTVFPVARIKDAKWKWQSWDLKYWHGDRIHLEAATAGDSPILASGKDRSWIGLRDVLLVKNGDPAPQDEMAEHHPFWESEALATSPLELSGAYAMRLRSAATRWEVIEDQGADKDALFLGHLLKAGLLPNSAEELPDAAKLVERYRELEAKIPTPTRAPGISEGKARDQPMYDRGDHKQPGETVPRRFLEAFAKTNYGPNQSGRRELAEDILHNNPLVARVIVNRLWHHSFGRGIVSTPDNFGQLGERPSHPDLLDYLAAEFVAGGYSIKAMLRQLVTSDAFQRAAGNTASDPGNRLLAHYPVRRLEAEAIRDAMLAASGRLDTKMYGGSQSGESPRRSVYVRVRRNDLDPFLRSFDAPEPLSTRGRRDVTNVPAQSLELMNAGFVDGIAGDLAKASEGAPAERIKAMFLRALGRPPAPGELGSCIEFVESSSEVAAAATAQRDRVRAALDAKQARLAAIMGPLRARLLAEKKATAGDQKATDHLKPIAAWEFNGDLKDAVGGMHGEAVSGAKIENGMLVLDGKGFVRTAKLGRELEAKTLEAWVQLDGLDQRGGGAVTVQTPDGNVFDAIVFGERKPRHWMSGSDRFNRTQDFDGSIAEKDGSRPVHLAITYAADGTVAGYRNGVPYGKPYKISRHRFRADAEVAFGIRHGTGAGEGRMLIGRIEKARLYDRALTEAEVRASSKGGGVFVTEAEVAAALGAELREERERLLEEIPAAKRELAGLEEATRSGDPWKELAHSILNLKEFIYLR